MCTDGHIAKALHLVLVIVASVGELMTCVWERNDNHEFTCIWLLFRKILCFWPNNYNLRTFLEYW
jgi:hypothetical protein